MKITPGDADLLARFEFDIDDVRAADGTGNITPGDAALLARFQFDVDDVGAADGTGNTQEMQTYLQGLNLTLMTFEQQMGWVIRRRCRLTCKV